MAGSGIGQGGAGGQPAMQASSGGKGGIGGQPAMQPALSGAGPSVMPTAADVANIDMRTPLQGGGFEGPTPMTMEQMAMSNGRPNGMSGLQPQGQYAPLAPQGNFNVNQASAGALQQSMQGAQAGMGFQAGQIMPTGYRASTAQATGYNPSTGSAAGYSPSAMTSQGYQAAGAGATGFNAANVGSQGYGSTDTSATGYDAATAGFAPSVNAQNVNAGQLANRDLGAYTNQYEDQVVQQTLGDIEQSRLAASNQLGAQATAANAFGGSRQGIAESETNRAYAEQAAKAASGLRQAGFTQAQQMAQQDIGTQQQAAMANQQANLQAGTTNAQFGQQTNLSNQAATNQASQFGAGASNQAFLQNAMASNQASQFGAGASNQAASQGANLQQAASQFGAGAANTAGLQNAMASNQASQFGSGAANQAASTNMAAQNAAGQFGANSQNQMTLSNMGAQNAAGQFGASAQNQMGLSNMGALNSASQYNANNAMSAQQQNIANQMQAQGMRMGAGAQLGQLGNQAFNTGQTLQQGQMQQGLMQQGLQQALIDAARGQYAGYANAPNAALAAPLAALGQTPNQSTTTSSKQPGLFDYLTLGATAAGGLSDTRLKTDIKPIGAYKGINLYTWNWNDEGKRIADPAQPTTGVMAQELRKTHPHLVKAGSDGYLRVNYAGLNSELEAA
jgi:hypothetical protein